MAEARKNLLYDKVLPRVERLCWLLAAVGLAACYSPLRGGSTLLIIGLGGLAGVYFLRAFEPEIDESGPELAVAYAPVSESLGLRRKFQHIAGALTLVGILFKLLLWKGQGELLLAGVPFLVVTISLQWASGQFVRSILFVAAIGLLTWAIPVETFIHLFHRDDPALVEKMIFQHRHPNDKAAADEVRHLLAARRHR